MIVSAAGCGGFENNRAHEAWRSSIPRNLATPVQEFGQAVYFAVPTGGKRLDQYQSIRMTT